MVKKEYHVENLSCAHCSSEIESKIEALDTVHTANLDFVNKKLVVQFTAHDEASLATLNKIAGGIEPGVAIRDKSDEHPGSKPSLYRYFALGGVLILLLIALLDLSPMQNLALSLSAYLLIGYRVLRTAVRNIFRGRFFDEHFLMSIATLGAMYLGEYTEAVAVMLLYEIGQYWEDRAVESSRKRINKTLAQKPDKARIMIDNEATEVPLEQVSIGAIIQVFAGERIPLDGFVRTGESSVDTSSLTGEAEPVAVSPGSQVFGGYYNGGGLLEIEVTNSEAESTISRISKLIESASAKKSETEKFITSFAKWYTPAVVFSAVLLVLIPVLLGHELSVWLPKALIFLISSCPCALVISIPLTYFIGIGLAARHGIIFKGSAFMDSLRKTKTFVFDKTGTLTTGKLKPIGAFPTSNSSEEELWETIYRCEFTSNHPLAVAVKGSASYSYNASEIESYKENPGLGVMMRYGNDDYTAGSVKFLRMLGYQIDTDDTVTGIYAVRNEVYLGYISFEDELRPGMDTAIKRLGQLGVKQTVMLTGDKQNKAEAIANQLGLDSFYAELMPEEKVSTLEKLLGTGKRLVTYAGDGLNDAPVLARADIGIAMGGLGSASSIEYADIVLMNDKPEQLTKAIELSRLSYSFVVQNVVLALGIKALVMSLGVAGIGTLWEAVIADVGVTVLAVLNSLRMAKSLPNIRN
ncbi:MAG TPA: heavy metal translocating P-type ATPase [Candidatus Cloacimonadota bacterium]|nr:heavy metal translocating P-type ATPase [Candidatus Cloacimonadota bacterium]